MPYPLRYRFAWKARLITDVLRSFLRAVFADHRRRARNLLGIRKGSCAAGEEAQLPSIHPTLWFRAEPHAALPHARARRRLRGTVPKPRRLECGTGRDSRFLGSAKCALEKTLIAGLGMTRSGAKVLRDEAASLFVSFRHFECEDLQI
jgi:hypothetical protein